MLRLLVAAVGLLLAWGLLEPYRLTIRHERVRLSHLPKAWQGARVALLSDLHVGMWLHNTATVRKAVAQVVKERPELVLIAGDFVHDTRQAIAHAVSLLRPLTDAGLAVYAVLGNHDYAMPNEDDPCDEGLALELRTALEGIGVRVLDNEAVALSKEDQVLYLVGIGAHVPGHDDPVRAFAAVPADAPRLVLMHHPNSFPTLKAHAAPLALAGHTHGGQTRLPLAPLWTYLTYRRSREVYTSGWIEAFGAEGNRLFVTQGIGCSVLPVRLNCPPELVFFELG
jgi:predicted MPP superfamily phosphohydrolase